MGKDDFQVKSLFPNRPQGGRYNFLALPGLGRLNAARMSVLNKNAGAWIDSIRIKTVTEEVHEGRPCIARKRTAMAAVLTRIANGFFRLAHNPVRVCTRPDEWLQWEVESFQLLNGKEHLAFSRSPDTVVTERLPGMSLARHFEEGSFREEMLESAAREMKRAHQLYSPRLKGLWSHGDANLANFLFDPETGRSRIIDFEIIPDSTLDEASRHAEDLLVFLQDLAGCIEGERWLAAARRFLESYGAQAAVLDRLKPRLILPKGIPKLWYWIRSNYIPQVILRARFDLLRESI